MVILFVWNKRNVWRKQISNLPSPTNLHVLMGDCTFCDDFEVFLQKKIISLMKGKVLRQGFPKKIYHEFSKYSFLISSKNYLMVSSKKLPRIVTGIFQDIATGVLSRIFFKVDKHPWRGFLFIIFPFVAYRILQKWFEILHLNEPITVLWFLQIFL